MTAFDVNTTVISQYSNSPILMQLVNNFSAYFEPTVLLDNFYNDVFNIDTVFGKSLDVIGRLVGVQRTLQVSTDDYFGFHEMGDANAGGFGQAPFYNSEPLTSNYKISDSAFKKLILIKAASNLTDCSIPALNTLLLTLFPGRGKCYVLDNQDMTMTYKFEFTLTPVEQAILASSGVIPRPSGVKVLFSY
jgi:Protein of unknown function (DUF2612)